MTTQTLNYLEAIAQLPAGGTLILTDVSWEEYEQLLTDLGDGYAVRITYNQERLEITRATSMHECLKEATSYLASTLAEATGVELESGGSTTFRQEWLERGVEPDACFFVQNATRIIGRDVIDLRTDPPPDIVVEIDVSHESTGKLVIYAGMNVPELWRYDEQRAHIYVLTDQGYVEVPASRTFSVLTSDALSQFLEQSKTAGQTAALRSFREWLRAQRS